MPTDRTLCGLLPSPAVCSSLLLLWVAASAGCNSRPSAPELRDTPIYQNKQEGFRFLVPEGWTQSASAVLPEGPLEGETFLVRYRMRTPEQGAMLQILCMQDTGDIDLHKHHSGPAFRVQHWEPSEPGETIDVNGTPAERHVHSAVIDGKRITKEAACFRRNNRIYSFVGLFAATDDKAREQIRRAVGSVIWES